MCHKIIQNASFHTLLFGIDQDLANQALSKDCPYCGEKLYQANYPRSPMGIPIQFRDNYDERFSFSCSRCRRRTTSCSVRFFGRRWYPAPLFVFISLLSCGISSFSLKQLKRHFGITISETTWKRWRKWWRTIFTTTLFWRAQGRVSPIIKSISLFLLREFKGPFLQQFISLLTFFSPLSINSPSQII